MADTTVNATLANDSENSQGLWGPYWINTTTAIIVVIDSGDDLSFARTTDSGGSWSTTEIQAGTTKHVACWFDQETPSDTGTLVHILWLDTAGEARYVTVDINDASVGTIRIVDSSVTVDVQEHFNRCAITKARDGNLIAAFLTQVEFNAYRSTDSFATDVTAIADVFETVAEEDYCLLFPANTGDSADVAALYWDRSEDEITVKMYDRSADTWTESSFTGMGAMREDLAHINMDAAVRHSDGFILGCAHTNDDDPTDDLITFSVNPNSISSPPTLNSVNDTELGSIFTNQIESAQCAILINQQNDAIYVAYLKGGTWSSSVDVVYHISTDGMENWGSEQAYSEQTSTDFRRTHAGRTVGDSGGFFQPSFYDNSARDAFVNLVNDVAIAASDANITITETDTLEVSEAISLSVFFPTLTTTITDTVTIDERANIGFLFIDITDTITLSEFVSVNLGLLHISITDTVDATDSVAITTTVEPAIFPPVLFRRSKTYKRM